jgi:hypothetical protein
MKVLFPASPILLIILKLEKIGNSNFLSGNERTDGGFSEGGSRKLTKKKKFDFICAASLFFSEELVNLA